MSLISWQLVPEKYLVAGIMYNPGQSVSRFMQFSCSTGRREEKAACRHGEHPGAQAVSRQVGSVGLHKLWLRMDPGGFLGKSQMFRHHQGSQRFC